MIAEMCNRSWRDSSLTVYTTVLEEFLKSKNQIISTADCYVGESNTWQNVMKKVSCFVLLLLEVICHDPTENSTYFKLVIIVVCFSL